MACGARRVPCLPGLLAELWWPLTSALQGELVHPLPAPVEELDPSGVGTGRGGQLGCNLLAPRLGLFQILFSKAGAPAQCGSSLQPGFPRMFCRWPLFSKPLGQAAKLLADEERKILP